MIRHVRAGALSALVLIGTTVAYAANDVGRSATERQLSSHIVLADDHDAEAHSCLGIQKRRHMCH